MPHPSVTLSAEGDGAAVQRARQTECVPEKQKGMNAMGPTFTELAARIGRYLFSVQIAGYLDIAIMAFLFYKAVLLVRATRVASLLKGLLVLLAALMLSNIFQLHGINYLFSKVVDWGVLALVILFQPEIRRVLEQMGSRRFIAFFAPAINVGAMEQVIAQTVSACADMSQTHTGALIIFEREITLDGMFSRDGTVLDAAVTSTLLKNIFFVKAPLHDGAVVIRAGRILGAGYILPQHKNDRISKELGTRHHAGVGISENSDAVVVIVSEETGSISVATGGMLKRHLTRETLENILRNELLVQEEAEPEKRRFPLPRFLRSALEGGSRHGRQP